MLNMSDRCDRCGAQAFVHVELNAGPLLLCGHHYRKYQDTIDAQALCVIDETKYLNAKPSMSATAD